MEFLIIDCSGKVTTPSLDAVNFTYSNVHTDTGNQKLVTGLSLAYGEDFLAITVDERRRFGSTKLYFGKDSGGQAFIVLARMKHV